MKYVPTKSQVSKALEKAGVPNETLLEGRQSPEGKVYNELINYHKVMLKVLMSLPEEVLVTEYKALLDKADMIKESKPVVINDGNLKLNDNSVMKKDTKVKL